MRYILLVITSMLALVLTYAVITTLMAIGVLK